MISLSICRFFIESECFDSDKKSVRLLMGIELRTCYIGQTLAMFFPY